MPITKMRYTEISCFRKPGTNDGVGHSLRTLDAGLAVAGGESLDLNHVAFLAVQVCGHIVERRLGLRAQRRVSRGKANLGFRGCLILVKVSHDLFHRV